MKLRNVLLGTLMVMIMAALPAFAQSDKVKVTYMTWGSGVEAQQWEERLARIGAENPDLDIEYLVVADRGEYSDRLLSMIAGGVPPEVFRIGLAEYRPFIRNGYVRDITQYVEGDPLISSYLLPQEKERSMVDGRYYGLGDFWPYMMLFYNVDDLAASGVAPPSVDATGAWTWDEFIDAARVLKRSDGEQVTRWGFHAPFHWGFEFQSWLYTFGTELYDPIAGRFKIDSEPVVNTVEALLALMFQQQVAARVDDNPDWHGLGNGRLSMYAGNMFWSFLLDDAGVTNYSIASLPKGIGRDTASTLIWGDFFTMGEGVANPDAAWRLLRGLVAETWQLNTGTPTYGFFRYEEGGKFQELIEKTVIPHGRNAVDPGAPDAWGHMGAALWDIMRGASDVSRLEDTNRLMNQALDAVLGR